LRALANPVVLRAAVLLFCSMAAFLLGLIAIRALRRKIADEADLSSASAASPDMPLHLYSTVIQQLKQQKHEISVQSQVEQHRSRISEILSQSVLSNLSTGVLVFGATGLVKTANPAAKEILGFASITGMNSADVFRSAATNSGDSAPEVFPDETVNEPVRLAAELDSVLREGSGRRQVEAEYKTPAGVQRFLSVTIAPVRGEHDSLLGVVCLIHDATEMQHILREREMLSELSAEKALQLRNSLATISSYARRSMASADPGQSAQFAADIVQEAEQLDRSIGGFLCGKRAAQGVAVGTSD